MKNEQPIDYSFQITAKNTGSFLQHASILSDKQESSDIELSVDGASPDCSYEDVMKKISSGELHVKEFDKLVFDFSTHRQMQHPILVTYKDGSSKFYVYPLWYFSPYQFQENMIDIRTGRNILQDLFFHIPIEPRQSVGMLVTKNVEFQPVSPGIDISEPRKPVDFPANLFNDAFPIWFENKTNESKTFTLKSDSYGEWVSGNKESFSGVECSGPNADISFEDFLKCMHEKESGKLKFLKFYYCDNSPISDPLSEKLKVVLTETELLELSDRLESRKQSQVTQPGTLVRYTGNNMNKMYPRPLFSVHQFQTRVVDFLNPNMYFDLQKDDGGERIQRTEYSYTIRPHTKIAFFVTFENENSSRE